jgi:hypothetical protein
MRCRGAPRRQSNPIEWWSPVTSELPLLVFDVNETLLDIEALAPHFQRIYGDAGVLREWFAQLILYSEAITLTGNYVPFGELAGAVARMLNQISREVISMTSRKNCVRSTSNACSSLFTQIAVMRTQPVRALSR